MGTDRGIEVFYIQVYISDNSGFYLFDAWDLLDTFGQRQRCSLQ